MASRVGSLSDFDSLDRSLGSVTSFKRGSGYEYSKLKLESNAEFIFFALGFLTGWGTFSRFAVYDVKQHAGLFQHAVANVLVVLPLTYMQLAIGQYTQMGPIHFKHINPLMHGIGYVFMGICILEIIQTATFLTNNMLYFLLTFQQELQWMICRGYNETCLDYKTIHSCDDCVKDDAVLSAQLYWKYIYMNNNYENTYFEFPALARVILLSIIWIVIYTVMINVGRQLLKVIRINVIVADALLLVLLGVSLCNPGSTSQLNLMFSFSLEQILSIDMWINVINYNIIYMMLGKGVYIMMGSFLTVTSQASILSIGAVFAGFVHNFIGAITMQVTIGILSSYLSLTQENMTTIIRTDFPRLHFIILPEAFGLMAAPQLWTAGYFLICGLMMFNNQIIYITMIERNLTDAYPSLIRYRKYLIALLIILLLCLTALVFSRSQFAVINTLTRIQCALDILMVCMTVSCVSYIYGVQKLSDDIHFFYGSQPTIFYKICWYVLPVVLMVCIYHLFVHLEQYGATYNVSLRTLEVILSVLLLLPIPISMLHEVYIHMKEKNMVGLFKSSERWGPADPEERHLRKIFNPREEIRSRRRYETCQHNCLLNSKVYKKFVLEEDKIRHDAFHTEKLAS